MLRYVLAFVIGLPVIANAQEEQSQLFYTRQECNTAEQMFLESISYGEQPLFVGGGITIAADGTPYVGDVVFTVNQDTGTWSLFTRYGDNILCLTAVGIAFEPY